MIEYFVCINTHDAIGCPRFDTLDEALEKYHATEMKDFHDLVALGIEADPMKCCFDILHKFYNENILINDYMNHTSDEFGKDVLRIVHEVMEKETIKYQYTTDILHGALIDYQSPVALMESKRTEEKWNEIYIETLKDNELVNVGWIQPTRETLDNYGWNYPKTCSYISLMNVSVYDKNGYKHDVDIDPRVYLSLINKKVSIRKEN